MIKFKDRKTGEILTVDQLRVEYKTEVIPDKFLGSIFTTFMSWMDFMMRKGIITKVK